MCNADFTMIAGGCQFVWPEKRFELKPYLAYNSSECKIIGDKQMSFNLTTEQMARYRATEQQRRLAKARRLSQRRQKAWEVAQQAGRLLRNTFGAQRVVVFGSVLYPKRFHERSDLDLAVWGLEEQNYYRVVSRLLDLDPAISVDLVEGETAPPYLLTIIEQEGVEV